jgi:hypothetical protein
MIGVTAASASIRVIGFSWTLARIPRLCTNAHDLKVDLSDAQEVALVRNHDDHVTGLLTLRRKMIKRTPPPVINFACGLLDSNDHGFRTD